MPILTSFDPAVFLKTVQNEKIDWLPIVPPIAVFLAKHPVVDGFDLSSLRFAMSGAAPLGADTQELLHKRLGCVVLQGYGMSEMSPVSHFSIDSVLGSIGKPIPNTICKIVDPVTGDPIPKSDTESLGELCVKGPQVMKGYLGRPEATADTFDADGFLKTGDLAKVDAAGNFYVVDRLKELIKYKGHQVPPAELEELLLTHNHIQDCAVIGVNNEDGEEIPMAFIVKADGPDASSLDEVSVMDFVASNVAPFMKVRRVEFTDTIPKAASGKILRRVLRDQVARQ